MAETLRRSKLLQAMTFFATRTSHCGKHKLYWLLYLLDFKIYAATSVAVTGLEYFASAAGPVPLALDDEMANPAQDFVQQFNVDNLVLTNGCRLLSLTPRGPFDPAPFSALERTDLEVLGAVHALTPAGSMAELPFLPTEPWRQTYQSAGQELELIDYRLVRTRPFVAAGLLAPGLLAPGLLEPGAPGLPRRALRY